MANKGIVLPKKGKMVKHIILGTDGTFVIIVHACPGSIGKFQWYLAGELNTGEKYILDGQIYESVTISSDTINNKYQNKWLYCKYEGEYIEDYVYLTNNFSEMISANQFDTIGFFGKDGNIRNDVSYFKAGYQSFLTGCNT